MTIKSYVYGPIVKYHRSKSENNGDDGESRSSLGFIWFNIQGKKPPIQPLQLHMESKSGSEKNKVGTDLLQRRKHYNSPRRQCIAKNLSRSVRRVGKISHNIPQSIYFSLTLGDNWFLLRF